MDAGVPIGWDLDGFDTEKEANDCNGNIGKFTTWREEDCFWRLRLRADAKFRIALDADWMGLIPREEICHMGEGSPEKKERRLRVQISLDWRPGSPFVSEIEIDLILRWRPFDEDNGLDWEKEHRPLEEDTLRGVQGAPVGNAAQRGRRQVQISYQGRI